MRPPCISPPTQSPAFPGPLAIVAVTVAANVTFVALSVIVGVAAGVTFSAPGTWTSWPPHDHAAMLEEAYLYVDMPAPAFGIQLVYTDARTPELAVIVRETEAAAKRELERITNVAEGSPGYHNYQDWLAERGETA